MQNFAGRNIVPAFLKECYDFDLKCDEENRWDLQGYFGIFWAYIRSMMNRAIGWEIRWQIIMRTVKAYGKGDFIALTRRIVFPRSASRERYSCSVLCWLCTTNRFRRIWRSGSLQYSYESGNDKEVKQTINSGAYCIFHASDHGGIHLAFAFPMIQKILMLMSGVEAKVFVIVTIGCYLVFALFYVLVYVVTSKAIIRSQAVRKIEKSINFYSYPGNNVILGISIQRSAEEWHIWWNTIIDRKAIRSGGHEVGNRLAEWLDIRFTIIIWSAWRRRSWLQQWRCDAGRRDDSRRFLVWHIVSTGNYTAFAWAETSRRTSKWSRL